MKKSHWYCHFGEHFSEVKAGKLGMLGGILLIGHLLFHVGELLIVPVILMAVNADNVAEAVEDTGEHGRQHSHLPSHNYLNLTGKDICLLQK